MSILTNLGNCYILIIILLCVFPFKTESSKTDAKKERNGKIHEIYKTILHTLYKIIRGGFIFKETIYEDLNFVSGG